MLRILHTVPCVVYAVRKKTTRRIEPNPYAYNVYRAATWSPERGGASRVLVGGRLMTHLACGKPHRHTKSNEYVGTAEGEGDIGGDLVRARCGRSG